MKRIDFYILPGSDAGARLTYACRLAAKAWREGATGFFTGCCTTARRSMVGATTGAPSDGAPDTADVPWAEPRRGATETGVGS